MRDDRLAVLVAFVFLGFASVAFEHAEEQLDAARDRRASALDAARIDLGVARFPSDAGLPDADEPALTVVHDWPRPSSEEAYRLAYAHGLAQIAALETRHTSLARRLHYQPTGDDTFTWRMPDDCFATPWTCIYRQVLEDNVDSLGPLVDRLADRDAFAGWSEADAARWLLAFVQAIPYEIPSEHAFGLLPPALVASHDRGDCDSKSLLLMAMLERIGIESVLLLSEAHAHALVGIAVPVGRDGFEERGREYAWAETTADIPLGHLHPSLRTPFDWQVVLRR